jgi:hypothetical protein
MILLQLLSVTFGLYMFYWSFLVYKKRLIYIRELIFWVLIWVVFIVVSLLPDSTKLVLQTFRITRTMDLLMIISFMVLWLVVYRNYIDNRKTKKKLQDLVSQDAIKEAMRKNMKTK